MVRVEEIAHSEMSGRDLRVGGQEFTKETRKEWLEGKKEPKE